jgi:hypothetical protein
MPPPNRGSWVHVSDQHIQALLTRYQCPTPMHVLRMRFLGAIASPRMEVSPIQLVTKAWGGELPEFASEEGLGSSQPPWRLWLWNVFSGCGAGCWNGGLRRFRT